MKSKRISDQLSSMDFEQFAADFSIADGRWAFGITGSGTSLELMDALERSGVALVTPGHEATAALMAGAYGRLTGKPALAVGIKGPGFMNLLPGLLSNAFEGYPSLSISESYPAEYAGSRCHKWLDHRRAGQEFLKRHRFFESEAGYLGACWSMARQEFPGPVHIELATGTEHSEDVQAAQTGTVSTELKRTVERAERPLLIVGSLGLRAEWGALLPELTIPIFTTAAAKGLVDESGPFAAGVFTGAGKAPTPERTLLEETDLLITLGVRGGELLDTRLETSVALHIDTIPVSQDRLFPARPLDAPTLVLSDAAIRCLVGVLREKSWGLDLLGECRQRLDDTIAGYPWSMVHAIRATQSALPEAVHVLDTGNFTVLAEHFLKAATPASVLGTPNGRYMGAGLGYSLGASIARPDAPVVLWVGDGGLRSSIGELALAADHRCKLLVMAVKDGYFGSVRATAMANGLTQTPVTLSDRSLVAIAEAMGLDSGTVADESELDTALGEWRRDPKPALLECVINPDEYVEQAARVR